MATRIMGVLNVTPDSFSDGGKFFSLDAAVAQAKRMAAEGADIIDIGGESSRPNAEPVSEQEELRRVIPVIEALRGNTSTAISIDTYKPAVAEAALRAGARMVNDITGLKDPAMRRVVAASGVPVVIMHMQGDPKMMQKSPTYHNVIEDIKTFFKERVQLAEEAGITPSQIILDPGIGFGKTLEHNLAIIKRLREFAALGFPLLVGPSRKSFIGAIAGNGAGGGLPAEERLEGTLAAVAASIMNGADIVRVHDVKETKRVVQVIDALSMVQ